MPEYIEREEYCEKHCRCSNEYCDRVSCPIWKAPAADVAPVVRCKDCIYTRKLYGRLVCKYGTCSGCFLREDFFCANGTRMDGGSNG